MTENLNCFVCQGAKIVRLAKFNDGSQVLICDNCRGKTMQGAKLSRFRRVRPENMELIAPPDDYVATVNHLVFDHNVPRSHLTGDPRLFHDSRHEKDMANHRHAKLEKFEEDQTNPDHPSQRMPRLWNHFKTAMNWYFVYGTQKQRDDFVKGMRWISESDNALQDAKKNHASPEDIDYLRGVLHADIHDGTTYLGRMAPPRDPEWCDLCAEDEQNNFKVI